MLLSIFDHCCISIRPGLDLICLIILSGVATFLKTLKGMEVVLAEVAGTKGPRRAIVPISRVVVPAGFIVSNERSDMPLGNTSKGANST